MDEDEPYSPGGSDDDDSLSSLPFMSTSGAGADYTKAPSTSYAQDISIQRKFEELNRQIEAEKKQIAMHLQAVDIDEPYSPTSSVSPTINPNLSDVVSNISIPANLADILKNISSVPVSSVPSTSNVSVPFLMQPRALQRLNSDNCSNSCFTFYQPDWTDIKPHVRESVYAELHRCIGRVRANGLFGNAADELSIICTDTAFATRCRAKQTGPTN